MKRLQHDRSLARRATKRRLRRAFDATNQIRAHVCATNKAAAKPVRTEASVTPSVTDRRRKCCVLRSIPVAFKTPVGYGSSHV